MMKGTASNHPGTAVVTGASSGIGAAFAQALAAQGYDLVLIARRAARLQALAARLHARYGGQVLPLPADLATVDGLAQVEQRVAALETLSLLVNNAGFGTVGLFAASDLAEQLAMIQVHVVASVRLCRAALPGMIARRQGAIINVASIGAFMPAPQNATYAATKAYLTVFTAALQRELSGTGVRAQALCPGFTHSAFYDTPAYATFDLDTVPPLLWMSAEQVVVTSLRALRKGPVVVIPGWQNRALVALWRAGLGGLLWRRMSRGFAPVPPALRCSGDVRSPAPGRPPFGPAAVSRGDQP